MTAYYNEWERYPAAWLRNLIVGAKIARGYVDERDIKDVRPKELEGYNQCHFFAGIGTWSYALRCAGWEDERKVWTGSCPCQPFSAAGKRRGTDDARHLWPEWFRLIRECRPSVIFGEQVASRDGLAWLDIVSSDLESEGYSIGAFDLCAASVGAPHIRQRLYFVAHTECRTTERHRQSLARTQSRDKNESEERERLRFDAGNGSDSLILAHSQNTEYKSNEVTSRFDKEATSNTISCLSEGRQGESGGGSSFMLLGHSDSARLQRWGDNTREHASEQTLGPRGATSILDNSESECLQIETEQERGNNTRGTGIVNFWGDIEWLPCSDGKARPTQPGIFPLVNGHPRRVARLRAIGNAIVAPLAAAFIRAYMESVASS